MNHLNLGAHLDNWSTTARNRLFHGRRRIWITAGIITLLAWQVGFALPIAGPDPSWIAGLYMAVHDGRDFGNQIVFTYGPLGFLSWPGLWFSWLGVLAFLFSALIFVAFAVALIDALERSVGLAAAAVVAFLFFVTLPDLEQVPLMLAVGLCFLALREDGPSWGPDLLAVGGGALSAFECLIKLSGGPIIVVVVVLGLAGARASRQQWLRFGLASLGGVIVLWLSAGQPLTSLPDYAKNGVQIIAGYNEAMAIGGASSWEGAVLVFGGIGLVLATASAPFSDQRSRWFAVAVVAVAAFSAYKYGIVRFEPGHVALGASALLGIWLQMPWRRVRAAPFLASIAVLGIVVTHTYPTPNRLDVVSNLKTLHDSIELLLRPGEREQKASEARTVMQETYNIDPKILAALKEKSVSVEPWETAIVWAYELKWSPLPVFQNYVAYTSKLDRLNAATLEDPDGPQAILRTNPGNLLPWGARTIEGRLPAWDPPEQALATLCNFRATAMVPSWQVLSRVPNRCGRPEEIGTISGQPGEEIAVPRAHRGEIVLLKLQGLKIEGAERLKSLLWKPPIRTAVLNGGQVTYRLVPDTAEDGLVVSRAASLAGTGGFEELPELTHIRIEGVHRPLDFTFYRVRIHGAATG